DHRRDHHPGRPDRPRRAGHRNLPARRQGHQRRHERPGHHPAPLARRLELHPAPPARHPAGPARRAGPARTRRPRPRLATPPRPAPPARSPAWLSHPTLPGHDPGEWNRLQARLPPRPAASLASRPSASAGTRILSPRDQLLATVLKLRWSAHNNTLASLFGVHQHTIANAIRQTTRDLADIGHHVPAAPIKARTTRDPAPLIGLEHAAKPECPINNPTAPWDHFHARDIRFGRPQAVICAPEGNGVVRRRSGRSSGRTATAWDRAGPDTGIRRWLIHTDV